MAVPFNRVSLSKKKKKFKRKIKFIRKPIVSKVYQQVIEYLMNIKK